MDFAGCDRLDLLARAAAECADASPSVESAALELEYGRLRNEAASLNSLHGWANVEEFPTMFPTVEQQRVIESLDRQLAVRSASGGGDESIRQLLRNLAVWAAAISVATRTLGAPGAGH